MTMAIVLSFLNSIDLFSHGPNVFIFTFLLLLNIGVIPSYIVPASQLVLVL